MYKDEILYYIERMYFLEQETYGKAEVLLIGRLEHNHLIKLAKDNKLHISVPHYTKEYKYYTLPDNMNFDTNECSPVEKTFHLHYLFSFSFGQLWVQKLEEEFHLDVRHKPIIRKQQDNDYKRKSRIH